MVCQRNKKREIHEGEASPLLPRNIKVPKYSSKFKTRKLKKHKNQPDTRKIPIQQ